MRTKRKVLTLVWNFFKNSQSTYVNVSFTIEIVHDAHEGTPLFRVRDTPLAIILLITTSMSFSLMSPLKINMMDEEFSRASQSAAAAAASAGNVIRDRYREFFIGFCTFRADVFDGRKILVAPKEFAGASAAPETLPYSSISVLYKMWNTAMRLGPADPETYFTARAAAERKSVGPWRRAGGGRDAAACH
ncbi:hypothetical protein EVAR_103312_1 [Eumeta japonica]|uniref:Uncharacterized protein n=1 Tax=Eumeta variegata TaxID=151549 RepID=A0A4C1XQJ5_EUMVA|nr:hypothetical protein EVAR_103312_1 [Eumeta japonica]